MARRRPADKAAIRHALVAFRLAWMGAGGGEERADPRRRRGVQIWTGDQCIDFARKRQTC
jgi:hypothetical protein